MSITFRLSPEVLQTIADAASIFEQRRARIRVSPNSISILLSNKAYIGYFELFCKQHTVCGLSDTISVGIDVGNFKRIATLMGNSNSDSDRLTAQIELNSGKIIFSYENFTYQSPIIPLKHVPVPFDDYEYERPVTIKIPSGSLHKVIKIADIISDFVTIGLDTETNTFYITAYGDLDDVEYKCDDSSISILGSADVETNIDLSYFAPFQKYLPQNVTLTIELGDNSPIFIRYQLLNSNISVVYQLQHTIRNGS